MKNNDEIKANVRERYSEIAKTNQSCGSSCCGTSADVPLEYKIMGDDYSKLDGYFDQADLGLGCGLPTQHAAIKLGHTVLDLGSGAGNDAFVARRIVGETGKVIGLDFTDEMIDKARANCEKLGYDNVQFKKGDIESMPIDDASIDVIISNCVLNLVPDKTKAFAEMYRALKQDGHFCVSDIVIKGELPAKILNDVAMYAGCIAGALQMDDYLNVIAEAGFKAVEVPIEKKITIPDEILEKFINAEELASFKSSNTEILSITVVAKK